MSAAAEWLYDAFRELLTERGAGMVAGPIPWRAVDAFAGRLGLSMDEFERLLWQVRRLEACWAAHPKNRPGKDSGRSGDSETGQRPRRRRAI